MLAAGESTADDTLTISVDSATTEEDKQKPSASSSRKESVFGAEDFGTHAIVICQPKDKGR